MLQVPVEISVHRDLDVSVRFTIRFDENTVRFIFYLEKNVIKNARKMSKRNEKLRNRVS